MTNEKTSVFGFTTRKRTLHFLKVTNERQTKRQTKQKRKKKEKKEAKKRIKERNKNTRE